MKITVAGYGFVGKSVVAAFEDEHQIEIVDPQYEEWNQPISQDTDAVIVCVSTPGDDDGSCYVGNIIDVIGSSPDVPILIKSTFSLEGYEQMKLLYPEKQISFSPEFLRAATAEEDFLKQKYMILGNDTEESFWSTLFVQRFPKISIHHCTNEDAIVVKYMENSFLAMKVTFFNELYDFCKKTGTDFHEVRQLVTLDERIGEDHSFVMPERGWGGHCFPKDTSAILHTASQYDAELSLIRATVESNKKVKLKQIQNNLLTTE